MIKFPAKVFTPEIEDVDLFGTSVFLAGTIEMGNSTNWQEIAVRRLRTLPINIFNPRRVVAPDEDKIAEQINWELDHIASSKFIYMFLAGKSVSPISLYELGLLQGGFAADKTVVLCCDPEYTRKMNVKVTTTHPAFIHPNIYFTHSFEGSLLRMKEEIKKSFTSA